MKNKVEQLRKERGLNQDDFAKAIRVSRQTISSIETGKYNPSLELAFVISEFFDKPITYFIGGVSDVKSAMISEILDMLSHMPADKLNKSKKILSVLAE